MSIAIRKPLKKKIYPTDFYYVSMETWLWVQKQDIGPSPRQSHTMVYHSKKQVVVLFGGLGLGNQSFNDTWEWDSVAWSQVADTGPSPRHGSAMAYDSSRDKTVLFGGWHSTGYKNDTWQWDGADWSQVADTGPSPRSSHAMVYDSQKKRIVLFGGGFVGPSNVPQYFNDTWEWNGSEWTQVADTGPSPRGNHGMSYDSPRDKVVLFSGWGGPGQFLGDTWEMSGNKWQKVQDTGPGSIYSLSMVHTLKGIVLFGGSFIGESNAPQYLNDTWQWDGKIWTQRQDIGPKPRYEHTMVYDLSRDKTVLFGGGDSAGRMGDTWELKIETIPG